MEEPLSRTRRLTIIAQDPSVKRFDGKILKSRIDIPAEEVAPGPRGYRVALVDYDTSTGRLYMPMEYDPPFKGKYDDPFLKSADKDDDDTLLSDPRFHCQNVYAIVMRTLARFEFALGRRVGWGFPGHQIFVAPHAFADANAFYSEKDRALCFGYFTPPEGTEKQRGPVFTCLSHDVVAHETTHALLDGLRGRYTDPSSPDQAGFHEGFADIVALLSVFSLKDVVGALLPGIEEIGAKNAKSKRGAGKEAGKETAKSKPAVEKTGPPSTITKKYLNEENLRQSVLLGLAEQMGQALSGIRGSALRRSVEIKPQGPKDEPYTKQDEYQEPHRRGELIVAAVLNSFLNVWMNRLRQYLAHRSENAEIDICLIIDEGASAADHLLTMCIRALDYTPPTDIRFGDFLSAILTADAEVVPDDSKYSYRKILLENFRAYGIESSSREEDGIWETVEDNFRVDRTHFESLLREPNEVFRFIWDNREKLDIDENAYTEVQSVVPCLRIAPDGFVLRETVAAYVQMVTLRAEELQAFNIDLPDSMPGDQEVTIYGGGNLVFDEYGKLKYHIRNRIFQARIQSARLKYLWATGYLSNEAFRENLFARMHLQKALGIPMKRKEQF
jgi:hypothetical protein